MRILDPNPNSHFYLKALLQQRQLEDTVLLELVCDSLSDTILQRVGLLTGTDPHKILKSGRGYEIGEVDPLPTLEAELSQYRVAQIPGITLPPLIGGAIVSRIPIELTSETSTLRKVYSKALLHCLKRY
jgi:hypothetical protein